MDRNDLIVTSVIILELMDQILVKAVANSTGCDLIDFNSAMSKREDKKLLLCDGLHLAASGNKLLADLVSPFIESLNVRDQWPDWKEKAQL